MEPLPGAELLTCSGRRSLVAARASFALLYLVCFIEGADFQLLPASFRALEVGMGLSPTSLAAMNLCQALAQSLSSPVWGVLLDRGLSGKALLVAGTLIWGSATLSLACVRDLHTMMALRVVNGLALATLNPVVQAIVADLAPPHERGRHFGWCGFSLNMGHVLCATLTTAISNKVIWGLAGWRIAFAGVALASFGLAGLLSLCMVDHRKEQWRAINIANEFEGTLRCFRIRTFIVLVVQGCFGSIPWSALAFLTMFFQYSGLPDHSAGMLMSLSMLASAIGQLLGGHIGDRMSLWSPHHGRPLTAQFSSFAGIPLVFSMLYLVPRHRESAPYYVALTMAFGLLASWCGNGVNRPVLTEVVPRGSQARVVTLLAALEGSCGACLGAPLVALLAEFVFHYHPEHRAMKEVPEDIRLQNLNALATAMLWMTMLPWITCFFVYSALHYTYRRDLEALSKSTSDEQTLVLAK